MYLTAFVPEALVDAIPPKLASAPGSGIFMIQNIKLTDIKYFSKTQRHKDTILYNYMYVKD